MATETFLLLLLPPETFFKSTGKFNDADRMSFFFREFSERLAKVFEESMNDEADDPLPHPHLHAISLSIPSKNGNSPRPHRCEGFSRHDESEVALGEESLIDSE
jgi:hypothetical protein